MLAALSVMLRDCGPSPCCRCRQPAPAGTPCALSRFTVWLTPVSVLSWLHAQAACTINDPRLALCLLPIMLRDAACLKPILTAFCRQPARSLKPGQLCLSCCMVQPCLSQLSSDCMCRRPVPAATPSWPCAWYASCSTSRPWLPAPTRPPCWSLSLPFCHPGSCTHNLGSPLRYVLLDMWFHVSAQSLPTVLGSCTCNGQLSAAKHDSRSAAVQLSHNFCVPQFVCMLLGPQGLCL